MGRRALKSGERGEIETIRQKRDSEGRWKTVKSGGERWRARCRYRGTDGLMGDVSGFGKTKGDALAGLEANFAKRVHGGRDGDGRMTPTMKLVAAGELWLAAIKRADSRLAPRTVDDYSRTWGRYIDKTGSSLRGLTLEQANDPQRLRAFLQGVADNHGTGAAQQARSVLMGVLSLAMDNGVVTTNALRNVRRVTADKPKPPSEGREARDTRRALTEDERAALLAHADAKAAELALPQTMRKWQTAADLLAFMAGTGARVSEARMLRWEDVQLTPAPGRRFPGVLIRGTKSARSHRHLTILPESDLHPRLLRRHRGSGGRGYVFASPHLNGSSKTVDGEARVSEPWERVWDQSNAAKTLSTLFVGAGYSWATPHCLRRTVASLSHQKGAPLGAIADQLGHEDPSMTLRVYIGRDSLGERESVAQFL